jgi:hypothetical protein
MLLAEVTVTAFLVVALLYDAQNKKSWHRDAVTKARGVSLILWEEGEEEEEEEKGGEEEIY